MQDFAMPQALELEGSRRNGIPALRREVVHNTTTQNEYRPSELCYIPIDTGAAGAFMDVSTTRLELTVVVRNKNYFIDFINLSRCGWHGLIQEFGIEINNGIHELNRHYAECVELEMIKMGQNRVPFEFTRSNPWKPAHGQAGKFHINYIKPSMVTAQGLPHNVQYPSLSTLTSSTTPDTLTQSLLLFSNPFLNESLGRMTDREIPSQGQINIQDSGWFAPSSFNIAQSYYDDRLISFQDTTSRNTYVVSEHDQPITQFQFNPNTNTQISDSIGNLNHVPSYGRVVGLPHGGDLLGKYSKQDTSLTQLGVNIYNCAYGQTVRNYPPSMWPAKQPCPLDELQKSLEESYRLANADSIMNYYANCKNIPVGVPVFLDGSSDGSSEIWGDSNHTAPSPENFAAVGAETEFHISLKIYSSLIGELAKKWFPELVVPQGRMRVRIRFQEPQILFQTLMDPCRRVPGTSRDWFPNLGVTDSSPRPITELTYCSPEYITSGIHPIMVSNYTPGDVYTDAIALGKYPIPMMRMKMVHDIFSGFDVTNTPLLANADNASTALGGGNSTIVSRFGFDNPSRLTGISENGGALSAFLNTTTNTLNGNRAMNALSQYHFELKKNQEFGFPLFKQTDPHKFPPEEGNPLVTTNLPTQIAHYLNYTHPQNWSTRYFRQIPAAPQESLPSEGVGGYNLTRKSVIYYGELDGVVDSQPKMKSEPNYDWGTKSLNWNPFCFPTPQYLPMSSSSNKSSGRILVPTDFVNENQTCFGSHKEHSVAQVRRTHSQLYPLQIPDTVSSRIDERITYIVKNVQIVTQQIVLPRTAALSIIENALNGGISMETRAWKEMESMMPKQETQKHLINMAAAFCTDISFVFRPSDTFQGDRAFGYNSFSFYNPFTSFRFEYSNQLTPNSSSERDYNYLGGRPIYYNECIIQQRTGFDIQLQLSSELLPRTPIDSIRRLIQHVRWGDQVFSDRDYMQLDPHLHPSYGSQKGMAINTLQDGFWACYCPISALDDQTITDNPFFTATELTLRKKLRGQRAPINALPFYKPFDGTFHLSFNLEAFMGQNEKIRTGVPIVNNNMFLKFEKAHMIRDFDTQLLTIAQCDARVVFERGGTMQFFT